MNDDNFPLLVAGGVLLYLIYTGKLNLTGRADKTAASGVPPRPGTNLVGALGAGACVAAATAYGMPALGVAAAPLCSAVAPYAVKGAVFLAEKTWDGAKFVGEKTADVAVFVGENTLSGLKATGTEARDLVLHPVDTVTKRVDQTLALTGGGLNLVDRGVTAGYGALPTYLKVAAAPAYAVTKVSTKAADVAVDVTRGAVGATKTVVNTVTSALGFGSSKVGRASNGKDVFPNDMAECAKRGITTVNECGALFDLTTRKWPWQTATTTPPPAGKPIGFR